MPIGEGHRPFQAQGVKIPIENVGVRGSGRRPGERRLHLVRPATPEQPRTLLQEMQQYITTRQSLRENGYFFLMGKEPEKINLAEATHNDLRAIMFDERLSDSTRQIRIKSNHVRMKNVFDAYAMEQFSAEKKKEVLELWEGVQRLDRQSGNPLKVLELTPAETETVSWLLARIGVPFSAPPEGFKEGTTSLLFRKRTAAAEHQQQWEQDQNAQERVFKLTRRR